MDTRTFRSFVKTAMELQADQDTPGDYTMVRAAVEARFPELTKEAVSPKWIQARVNSPKNTTPRLKEFVHNMRSKMNDPELTGRNWLDHDDAHSTAERALYQRGVTKIASAPGNSYVNALELTGLGTLAAPAAAGLAGYHPSEKTKEVAEVAGLGMLAAPYAHSIAAGRSSRYAGSGLGQKLTRALAHH